MQRVTGLKRLLAFLLIVLAIWVGVTVYQEGVDQAFGGAFARFAFWRWEPAANRPVTNSAEDAFQRAFNKSEERVDELMREPEPATTEWWRPESPEASGGGGS